MGGADPVVDRARAFLEAVFPIIRERCRRASDQPIEFAGLPNWVLEAELLPGMRRYKALPTVIASDRQCALRVLGELRETSMDELADLERALAADAVIGPRTRGDSVISFGAGGGAWQVSSLVLMLVEHAIIEAGGFKVATAATDRLTTEWATALRRPSDRVTVVVSLLEFDTPNVPITLEPGLEIVELSNGE